MARTTATNFSGGLQFSYATAATDIFKKEDVQTLAQAVDQHDHTAGKGHSINTVPANASITNAMLGPDVARANLLTNGGFEIWQRGNGPFAATGIYVADRWALTVVPTDTLSVSRDQTNRDINSASAAACTFSLGSGGGATQLYQNIPVTDTTGLLGGPTMSASVRVKTSVANAVRIGLNSYTGSGNYTYSAFHPGDGAWHTLTVTKTLDLTMSIGQIAVLFAASCTAYIDNATLVVGSQPADYAPLHPADDLSRCLRYYELLGTPGIGDYAVSSYNTAGTPIFFPATFKSVKSVTPTVTKVGTWTTANCSQPTITAPSVTGFQLGATITALGYGVFVNSTAGNTFTVEANP